MLEVVNVLFNTTFVTEKTSKVYSLSISEYSTAVIGGDIILP